MFLLNYSNGPKQTDAAAHVIKTDLTRHLGTLAQSMYEEVSKIIDDSVPNSQGGLLHTPIRSLFTASLLKQKHWVDRLDHSHGVLVHDRDSGPRNSARPRWPFPVHQPGLASVIRRDHSRRLWRRERDSRPVFALVAMACEVAKRGAEEDARDAKGGGGASKAAVRGAPGCGKKREGGWLCR